MEHQTKTLYHKIKFHIRRKNYQKNFKKIANANAISKKTQTISQIKSQISNFSKQISKNFSNKKNFSKKISNRKWNKKKYSREEKNMKKFSRISQKKSREISGMREDRESFCD
jgi:galactokinase/mevalonate kinase-like predicted kinase